MDIGSIFPLYQNDFISSPLSESKDNHTKKILFSLCREVFYAIAENYEKTNKIVLLPAYTCDTVYMPFKQLGWKCIYYSLNEDLRINVSSLKEKIDLYNPTLVVAHPYFGMDFNDIEVEALKSIKQLGVKLVIDITQCIFSKKRLDFVDYYVGSYRKWLAIPDGAFLEIINEKNPININLKSENDVFVAIQQGAMFLRGCYFCSSEQLYKDISRKLSAAADEYSDGPIIPHKISAFSEERLKRTDIEENMQHRMKNFDYLYQSLSNKKIIRVCRNLEMLTTAPLYFVIYVKERASLQKRLIENHIYAPIIWPVKSDEVLIDKQIENIYNTILAIPIDQRYSIADMDRIVQILNDF